jgi:hypothetical protein
LQLTVEQADDVTRLLILLDPTLDQLAGVDNGSVVLASEGVSDIAERAVGQLAREKHRHLPREGDVSWTSLARHIGETDVKMLGHLALNLLDGDRTASLLLKISRANSR